MTRTIHLQALVMAGALAFSSAAAAAPLLQLTNDPSIVSEKVSVAELNMQSTAGAKAALMRIRRAADDICGPEPSLKSLDMTHEHHACMQKTIGGAVAAAHVPTLTALYEGAAPASTVLATAQR